MTHRTFAIGDIHGELETLKNLVASLNLNKGDKLIFLGDYIDKGAQSKQVVDFLIDLSKAYDCIFIRGNHEEFLLEVVKGNKIVESFWDKHGSIPTMKSYNCDTFEELRETLPPEHLEFYKNTVSSHETPSHVFVHANWECDKPAMRQSISYLRYQFLESAKPDAQFKKQVVVGHSGLLTGKPAIKGNFLCIDTIENGWLTAYDVKSKQFHQVNKKNQTRILNSPEPYAEKTHVAKKFWRKKP